MPRISYGDMTPDERDDFETHADDERTRRQDDAMERKYADRDRRENHPNRQVHRERFSGG